MSPQRDGPNGVITADTMGWFAKCPLQYLPAWILTRSSGTTSDYLLISPEDWVRLLGNRRNINPPHRDRAVPEKEPNQVHFLSSPYALGVVWVKDHRLLIPATTQTAVKLCIGLRKHSPTNAFGVLLWFPPITRACSLLGNVGKLSQETSEDTALYLRPGSVSHHTPRTRVLSLPCSLTATAKSRPHGT